MRAPATAKRAIDVLDERMELVALAHRRYPDMELLLAVMCFQSDRRRAGIGALKEKRRHPHGIARVINGKRMDLLSGRVTYDLVRLVPALDRIVCPDYFDFDPNVMAQQTVQVVREPERRQHLCVPADARDLHDQRGRRRVADMLRLARKMLRNGEGCVEPR